MRIGRHVYSFGGQTSPGGLAGGHAHPSLVPTAYNFQVLDTVTGTIEVLEPTSNDCEWPAPRSAASLAVWRERFLVMFGGKVRIWNTDSIVVV
jgi:hypothetical protein